MTVAFRGTVDPGPASVPMNSLRTSTAAQALSRAAGCLASNIQMYVGVRLQLDEPEFA